MQLGNFLSEAGAEHLNALGDAGESAKKRVLVATDREGQLRGLLRFLENDYDVVMAPDRRSITNDPDLTSVSAIIATEQPSDLSMHELCTRLNRSGRRPHSVIAVGTRGSPWMAFVEHQTDVDGVLYLGSPVEHQIQTFGLLTSRDVDRQMAALGDEATALWNQTNARLRDIETLVGAGQPIPRTAVQSLAVSVVDNPDETLFMDVIGVLRAHHSQTLVHSLDVALNVFLLGRYVGVRSREDQQVLFEAGLLHDIGKLDTPLAILDKPGKLTADEVAVVRRHPATAERLLRDAGDHDDHVILAAAQHHEKSDGTGYPRGLTYSKISEVGRLMAVCDVYCALTERRAYKPQSSPRRAFDIMQGMVGHHLDGVLVARLQDMVYGHMAGHDAVA